MFILKKRVPRGSILLFVSFAAISLSFLMIVSAVHVGKYNIISKNSLYTGHEVSFSIYDSFNDDLWDNIIPKLSAEYNDFALYCPMKDSDFIMRGLYIKGEVVTPPMVWGNYFDEYTSYADEPMAVIGSSYEKDIQEKNGKKYYAHNGTDYEVIGIMGTDNDTMINEMVFVNFKSAVWENSVNTGYVLDVNNRSEINNIGHRLEQLMTGWADCIIALPEESEENMAASLLSRGIVLDTLYIMLVICFSLCTIIITGIWMKYRRHLFFAMNLCGFTKCARLIEVYKKYVVIVLAGYVAGVGLVVAASLFLNMINVYLIDILFAFILSVCLGTLIFALSYVANNRRLIQ